MTKRNGNSLSRCGLVLLGILCLAAGLRFYDLAGPELQWDEFLALHRAEMPLPQLIDSLNNQSASDVFQDTSPPLHHILIHVSHALIAGDFALRLPSVLFGLASIVMLFLVGRQFFDDRAGLCTALYAAILQFHIAYSRYMRWYVFFYTFALLSLYFYQRMLDSQSRRNVIGYSLSTALMLYSSYIAAPFVLAQMAFTAGLFLAGLASRDDSRSRWSLVRGHFLGLTLAGILYLPQLKGQLVAYYTFYQTGGHSIDPYRVAKALREITLYFRDSDFAGTGLVLVLMGIGMAQKRTGRARRGFFLLLLWCAVPTLFAFCINVQTQITAKYLIGMYFAILLFAGAGAAQLAKYVVRQFLAKDSRFSWACSLTLGFAAILCIAGPNLDYAPFYRGWQRNYSNWARYLLANKQDVDSIMFEYNRPKKVILTHELGDAFSYFDAVSDHAYRKFYYVTQKGGYEPPGLVRTKVMPQNDETLLFSRGGIVSRAPLVVAPDHHGLYVCNDAFDAFRFYETVWEARNVAPDYNLRALSLYSLDNPGQATWKLQPAPGVLCRSVALRLQAVLRSKFRRLEPDARVQLFVGPDPDKLALVETIDFARFAAANPALGDPASAGSSTLRLETSAPWSNPDAPLYIRLAFVPGRYGAFIDVERFGFDVACEQRGPAADIALTTLRVIAANTRLAPWKPGAASLGADALHVFCSDDARCPRDDDALSWQSAAALSRFREAYPGLPPVSVVNDGEGRPVFEVYDPRLAQSALALAPGVPQPAEVDGALPWPVRGLSYTATAARPTISLGSQTMTIPLAVPEGATAALNPGGDGLVIFSPLFTPDGFNLYNMVRRDNLNVLNNTLGCLQDSPCLAQYVFASELPIRGLRAIMFPALKNDKPNYARLFYGINDMAARNVLLDFSERSSLDMSSTYEGVAREIHFDKDVKILFVGVELSGHGATIQSDEKYTMRIELLLDAGALPLTAIDQTPVAVSQTSLANEAMRLWLGDRPLPLRKLWSLR